MKRHHIPRPPYIDPDYHIVYDVNDADLEGFLTKQSMWLKDWRRRYFILKGSRVFFSKNEFASPHGMIDLSKCTTVKSADIKTRKLYSFEISTPTTTYLLYADSDREKDEWIGGIGRAIVRCSSTFQRKGYGDTVENELEDDDDAYSNSSNNPYYND